MYSDSQQSICFWNRYNVAWPCRPEPSSDRSVPTTAVCSVRVPTIKLSDPHRTATASLIDSASSVTSTYHISFVLWYHSNLARKEHLSPVLSSAKQRVCLQSSVFLSLPSTNRLATLVVETVTGYMYSKIFRETAFSATCHLSPVNLSLVTPVASWNRLLEKTGIIIIGSCWWY